MPQFPRPGDPVHAFVLAAVQEATAPLHQRLNELEERSLYLIRRLAEGTAYQPVPSRPEAAPPAPPPSDEPTVVMSLPPLPQPPAGVSAQAPPAKPRGQRWRKVATVFSCALALGLGSFLGLTPSCH
jgi:hypothetical protein